MKVAALKVLEMLEEAIKIITEATLDTVVNMVNQEIMAPVGRMKEHYREGSAQW